MFISTERLALDALAIVVAFGVGFLLWTLFHLCCESTVGPVAHLFHSRKPARLPATTTKTSRDPSRPIPQIATERYRELTTKN